MQHGVAEVNGISMHYVDAGTGPAVILCHGWPELWFSWHRQIPALVGAGYRVLVPDQRGYGQTDRPAEPSSYSQMHLVGDIVGLLQVTGEKSAVIVGHDFGAQVAWNAALMRPDLFTAVAALSVPFRPRTAVRPTQALAQDAAGRFHYMQYVQQPGLAEEEFERNVRAALRRTYYMKSGGTPREHRWRPVGTQMTGMLEGTVDPNSLPAWLTEKEFDYFVGEFERTGFRGAFNWYRAYDQTWEATAPFAGATIQQPALYIAGAEDPAMDIPGFTEALARMPALLPGLESPVIIPDAGHWVQLERADEVNTALIAFLRTLKG